jgi:hypothetical protein
LFNNWTLIDLRVCSIIGLLTGRIVAIR